MSIFKNDKETKRMIFNIYADIAERLDKARELSRSFDKRLDVDSCVNKAIEKFLRKAEKKLEEMQRERKATPARASLGPRTADPVPTSHQTPDPGQDLTPDPAE